MLPYEFGRGWTAGLRIAFLAVGLSLSVGTASAEDEVAGLHESLAAWESFLGTWEIDATWTGGNKLWSKGEYRPVMGGRFINIKTWVRDGDGPMYLRYESMLGAGAEDGTFTAHNFVHDGKYQTADYRLEDGALVTAWEMGGTKIRERLTPSSETETRWQVWMQPPGSEDWMPMMDGTWRKVSAAGTEDSEPGEKMAQQQIRDIDSSLFVASGPGVRGFELEETFAAPAADVFSAFSDGEAFKAAYGPEREALVAAVDLAVGGRYEWLFDGKVGSNGCQVLSYAPGRMVSFTWNAPPQLEGLRDLRTWVVVQLDPTPGGTAVRLGHWGFGDGADWDEAETYFKEAWAYVLGTLKKNLEARAAEAR